MEHTRQCNQTGAHADTSPAQLCSTQVMKMVKKHCKWRVGKTHSAGSNMFFSSTHCVGMGDLGPSTPWSCCRLGFCHWIAGPDEAPGGPGRLAPTKPGAPTGTVFAPLPPGAPAKRFIKAARALAVNFSPPCSPAHKQIQSVILPFIPKLGRTLTTGA